MFLGAFVWNLYVYFQGGLSGVVQNRLFEEQGLFRLYETPNGFRYDVYGKDVAAINLDADMIEKWIPKKGELCIFWSCNRQSSTIGVFIEFRLDSIFWYKATDVNYTDCIPFLSEQQYKRHIGYEK